MHRRECIRLLKEMKTIHFEEETDKTVLLENIKPILLKLRKGRDVHKQIAEYVYADQYDMAVKHVKNAFRYTRFWPLSQIPRSKLIGPVWIS
jgi:hypothetical protein